MGLKERIQELCKKRNISMNQLETDLGFGKGYISKLGKSTPNVLKIQKIAEKLNVSVDYLMNGDEQENNPRYYLNDETAAIAQEIFQNKELRMLFDASRNAKPEDLLTVRDMMLALKRKERGDTD